MSTEGFEDKLAGVITLGYGTQPLHTIKKIFYKHNEIVTKDYFEIGKMCFAPEYNGTKNFGSRAMSLLIKWMKENTDCLFCYTLADGIMGKLGFVYQASNFNYIGSFRTKIYRDSKTGEKVHPRTSKNLCKENAEFIGKDKVFWLTHEFCEFKGIEMYDGLMFRYIYPLNKTAKKILTAYPEYRGLQAPKNNSLKFWKRVQSGKFDIVEQPQFNMDVLEHNYQKLK
jgi:hypothetical protein